jgi:hypothetical protein
MRTTGAIYASNRHRNEAGINRNHDATTWTATNGESLLTTRWQQTSIEPIYVPVHDEIRNTLNSQVVGDVPAVDRVGTEPTRRLRREAQLKSLRTCAKRVSS